MKHDYLIHYGVTGMKWGIRKQRESTGGISSRRDSKNDRYLTKRANSSKNYYTRNYYTKAMKKTPEQKDSFVRNEKSRRRKAAAAGAVLGLAYMDIATMGAVHRLGASAAKQAVRRVGKSREAFKKSYGTGYNYMHGVRYVN